MRARLESVSEVISKNLDEQNGVIRNVVILTADANVTGHGERDEEGNEVIQLWTDSETLESGYNACLEAEPVKCKINHLPDMDQIIGDFRDFRIDGDKLRGNLHLHETLEEKKKARIFEWVKKIPHQFGTSIDANLYRRKIGDVLMMRVNFIRSIDIVDTPAVNHDGLFNAKKGVDCILKINTKDNNMEKDEIQKMLEELMQPVIDRLAALEESATEPNGDDKEKLAALEAQLFETTAKLKEYEEKASAQSDEEMQAALEAKINEKIEPLQKRLSEQESLNKQLGRPAGAGSPSNAPSEGDGTGYDALLAAKVKTGLKRHEAALAVFQENPEVAVKEAKKRSVSVFAL